MEDFGKKLVEKIKCEKICPAPKWRFLLRNYFVWLAFAASVVVGGLAFCVTLSIVADNDWDIYKYLNISPIQHILLSLPYLWIVLLVLFLGLAFYNYKHTKCGYRHGVLAVLGLSIVGSLLLGSFFHYAGMGRKIDQIFAKNVPLYQNMHCCCNRQDIWSQPEKGLLGGRIIHVSLENDFDLEDFQGAVWQIENDRQIFMRGPTLVREGGEVKLIGERKAEKIFWAREIRPWMGWGSDE